MHERPNRFPKGCGFCQTEPLSLGFYEPFGVGRGPLTSGHRVETSPLRARPEFDPDFVPAQPGHRARRVVAELDHRRSVSAALRHLQPLPGTIGIGLFPAWFLGLAQASVFAGP